MNYFCQIYRILLSYVDLIFTVLSEKDENISQRLQESIRESKGFLNEQRSMSFGRFRRRLEDFSMSNSSSGKTGVHLPKFIYFCYQG